LEALISQGYAFQPFAEFIEKPAAHAIILRHDVDARPGNSLEFARIQNQAGIRGSYYFRAVPQSYDELIIKEIADLGHEIGYHYEDMEIASSKFKVQSLKFKEEDLYEIAIEIFEKNLKKFRELYPVKTICMHGSPRSKFDNKSLWKKYNYRDYGIIGEPYFDIDFNEVLYLTDTGRRWDGAKVSIRDKVNSSKFEVRSSKLVPGSEFRVSEKATESSHQPPATSHQKPATSNQNRKFHSTSEIINAALNNNLPNKIMFTFHPQRWTDKPLPWMRELVLQNMKNVVKRFLVKR
jgi:hypothetical protein